jgi:predicted nucleic acid-binding protein
VYLVDTNVISAGAPSKGLVSAALPDWMDRNSDRLYLSAITVVEIEDRVAKSQREGATRKAAMLREWLEALLHLYADRVLSFDLTVARIAGALSDLARGKGQAPGFQDIAIAATASAHRLTILTRNTRHFAPFGIQAHDPFDTLPD